MELQPIHYPPRTYHHHSHTVTGRQPSAPHPQHEYTLQQLYSHLPVPRHPSTVKAIRVLDLDPLPPSSISYSASTPSFAQEQQPLTGSLRVINFASCPDFTALSYVWGNDHGYHISIRGDDSGGHESGGICQVPITRNCREALVALRRLHSYGPGDQSSQKAGEQADGEGQVLTIWVDAICINQKDEREKEGQLPLMGEIYTWASKVWIWLGPTCPNASPNTSPARQKSDYEGERKVRRAIIGLKRAAKLRATPPGMPWIDSSMHRKQMGQGPRTTLKDTLLASRSLARVFLRIWLREPYAQLKTFLFMCCVCFMPHPSDLLKPGDLEYLLDREWLQRAWTFQEIILASNPIVLCGDEHIAWTELQQGLDCLSCLKPTFLVRGFLRHNPLNNDIHSASDVPTLFETGILSPEFRFPGPSPANSQAVRAWQALLRVWRAIARPTTWNGNVFRTIPHSSPPSHSQPHIHPHTHHQALTSSSPKTTTISTYNTHYHLPLHRLWSLILRPLILISFLLLLILPASLANQLSRVEAKRSQTPPFPPHWPAYLSIPYYIFIFLACCGGLAFIHVFTLAWGRPVIWSFTPRQDKRTRNEAEEDDARNALVAVTRALRERSAGKPMDKSFAMRGVLERLGIFLQPADYGKRLGEVYHELFVGLLRREPVLIALLVDADVTDKTRRRGAEERENSMEGAPSWVPDWSKMKTKHWINYDETIYQRIQLGVSQSGLCRVDHRQNDHALIVQAVILCQITYISSPIGTSLSHTEETIPDHYLRTSLAAIDDWLSAIKHYAPSTPPYHFNPTAVLKTLYPFAQPAPMNKRPNLRTGYPEGRGPTASYFNVWNEILNGPDSEYMYHPDQRQQLINEVLHTQGAKAFTYNVCKQFAGDTRLFISSSSPDGFIGKGSKGMREGDLVALIRGVGQPMVLRENYDRYGQSDGSFMVVGPASACRLVDLQTFRSVSMGLDGREEKAYDPERDGMGWRNLCLV